MDKAIMHAHDLRKDFQMGEVTVHALQGVDLALQQGQFLAIMGPSGSGKSTLLHILSGLERPSAGVVELGSRSLTQMSDKDLTLLRRRKIGVVFQFFNLLPNLNAVENVALPLLLDGHPLAYSRERALQTLAWVGLDERVNHTPDRLSGGEQQRVALARALVFQPQLLLADEPTGNLDRASGEQVLILLKRACSSTGQTIVMVTHDPLAASFADRVVFLADGFIVDELSGGDLTPEIIIKVQARLQSRS